MLKKESDPTAGVIENIEKINKINLTYPAATVYYLPALNILSGSKHKQTHNMPTTYANKSLGVTHVLTVPTLQEMLDTLPHSDLQSAIHTYSCHQGWNVKLRRALKAHYIAAGHELKQKSRGGELLFTGKDNKTPVMEGEGEFFARLIKEGIITEAQHKVDIASIGAKLPWELKVAGEDTEPDDVFFDSARQILAMAENGTVSKVTGNPVCEEDFVANWSAKNPGHNFTDLGGWTELGIARALEINEARVKAAAASEMV